MNKLEDLYTLVGLLKNFELPISPILEFAIKRTCCAILIWDL